MTKGSEQLVKCPKAEECKIKCKHKKKHKRFAGCNLDEIHNDCPVCVLVEPEKKEERVSSFKCPKCGGEQLMGLVVKGIQLDICPNCEPDLYKKGIGKEPIKSDEGVEKILKKLCYQSSKEPYPLFILDEAIGNTKQQLESLYKEKYLGGLEERIKELKNELIRKRKYFGELDKVLSIIKEVK